jgi:hypothetical protein
MNKNYAIFVACTPNFKKYLNALLNSIEKQELYKDCCLTVYVLHHEMDDRTYLRAIAETFSYTVIPVEVKREEVDHPPDTKRIEFIKRARFKYVLEYGSNYDVICLLDADMFFVNPDFMKLFDLVNGTDQLIGCNEKFKWTIGSNYVYDKAPIFFPPQKLYRMHCSVPIIFNLNHWKDVFEYYLKIAFYGREFKKEKWQGIGDIMSWNMSVYKCGKQDNIIVFPMEVMCQVHQTYIHPDRYINVENGYWYTEAGDRIYSIQGRWNANLDFLEDKMRWCKENFFDKIGRNDYDNLAPKIQKGLIAIQQEWFDLNYCSTLKLEEDKEKHEIFNRRDN